MSPWRRVPTLAGRHVTLRPLAAHDGEGARRDGVLRGHQIVDGRSRDSVVYPTLDREWPAVRQNLDSLLERHA